MLKLSVSLFLVTGVAWADVSNEPCSALLTVDTQRLHHSIHWVGGQSPSYPLFKNTAHLLRKAGSFLKKKSTYFISSFKGFEGAAEQAKSLHRDQDGWHYFSSKNPNVKQRISENGRLENRLLELSDVHSNPHEVGQIRLLLNGKTVSTSTLLEGGEGAVPQRQVDLGSKKDVENLLEQNQSIDQIVYDHTHPMAQLTYMSDKGIPSFLLTPLSRSDLIFARTRSMQFPNKVITIRAITPSGMTFSASFLNGKPI